MCNFSFCFSAFLSFSFCIYSEFSLKCMHNLNFFAVGRQHRQKKSLIIFHCKKMLNCQAKHCKGTAMLKSVKYVVCFLGIKYYTLYLLYTCRQHKNKTDKIKHNTTIFNNIQTLLNCYYVRWAALQFIQHSHFFEDFLPCPAYSFIFLRNSISFLQILICGQECINLKTKKIFETSLSDFSTFLCFFFSFLFKIFTKTEMYKLWLYNEINVETKVVN